MNNVNDSKFAIAWPKIGLGSPLVPTFLSVRAKQSRQAENRLDEIARRKPRSGSLSRFSRYRLRITNIGVMDTHALEN